MHRRTKLGVSLAKIGALLQQRLDTLRMPILRGLQQGEASIPCVNLIRVGALPQQSSDALRMPILRGPQ